MEVSSQLHVPADLPPGEEPPVPIGQEAGWDPEPVWTLRRREKVCPYRDSNSDTSAVQPVASHYFDWAIPNQSQSQIYFTTGGLPPAKSLEDSRPAVFLQMNPCGHSPYVISSLTRGWVCLLWICLAFRKVYLSYAGSLCIHTYHVEAK
jgi:hypothetical protein